MQWLKELKMKLFAPWTRLREHEQLIAGLLLELAQNGIVLKRLEKEMAGLMVQMVEDGIDHEEVKQTIAFMLMEIAKEEKQ